MNKYAGVVLVAIILMVTGCDDPFGYNVMEYKVNSDPLDLAWKETASFTYILKQSELIKSPREFIADGGGDCADFSAYLIYLLGLDASFVILEKESGAFYYHVIVLYHNKYIEPQMYGYVYDESKIKIKETIPYKDIMQEATSFGMRTIQ